MAREPEIAVTYERFYKWCARASNFNPDTVEDEYQDYLKSVEKHNKCFEETKHRNQKYAMGIYLEICPNRDNHLDYKIFPIDEYILCEKCDCEQSDSSGPKYGCEACDYLGFVTYYFNSEPNELSVIGINDRMIKAIEF